MSSPWLEEAQWLAGLLVNSYSPAGGLLARRVEAGSGRVLDPRGLVDELGDYAQYVWLVGRQTGRDDLCGWALGQARLAGRLHQRANGLILRRPVSQAKPVEFFNALEVGDTLWGLMEMSLLTGDAEVARSRDRLLDGLWRLGLTGGQVAYGALFRGERALAAVPLTEPMTAGYVGESLVEIHRHEGRRLDLARAQALLTAWLETGSFRRHGLFSRWVTRPLPGLGAALDAQFRLRGRHGLRVCKLVKGDTYLVMALLALWRVTAEERIAGGLTRWLAALERLRLPDGRFANYLDLARGRRWWVRLGENHSVIEALCDLAHDLGLAHAQEMAFECADAWLARRTPEGLVAEEDGRAYLDPQTDFAVCLLKLAQMSGRPGYAEAADRLLRSTLAAFRLPHGLAQAVERGKPVSGEVETKFLGLFLKGLLVREAFGRGQHLMAEPALRRLASDR